MKAKSVLLTLLISCAVLYIGYRHFIKPRKSAFGIGHAVPEFSVKKLDGTEFKLSNLAGKTVLINIWATWCAPCREEMPSLGRLHSKVAGKGIEIMAISIDTNGPVEVRKFVEKNGIQFPVYLDPENRVGAFFRTTGVPETFIMDRSGTLIKKFIGPRDWDEDYYYKLLMELS
jgi:thiol-disulfide isomerase/thioredoxin